MAVGSGAEALRLAEASDWKGLQRLVERRPEAARARGEYGMLPLHWACTERRVPLSLLERLLAAHPRGARARNAAELLPLHIAIRAGAPAAWLSRLAAAFPGGVQARLPSGETAVELAEAMRLDAERLKVLYQAERELSPELDSDRDELEGEGEDDVLAGADTDADADADPRGSVGGAKRAGEPRAWPAPPATNGYGTASRLSAATELSDAEVVDDAASSSSSLSEGAVRLSASRDLLVSPSSVSSRSGALSPPSSVSAPVPLSQAWSRPARGRLTAPILSRRPSGSGASSDERDLRSMISTSLGGRHQSLPIIPSFDAARHGSFASDDSDVGPSPAFAARLLRSQPSAPREPPARTPPPPQTHSLAQTQQLHRSFQTQPHPGKQRHHSPFAYRRASVGESALSGRGGSGLGLRRSGGGGSGGTPLESPPEWRLDDECAICRATFNMFKHRHHCRNCGKSICRQHSADKKIPMASKGFSSPQRVCITCFAVIAQSRSLQRDLALPDLDGEPLLNPVAFRQQHYAGATGRRATSASSSRGTRRSSLRASVSLSLGVASDGSPAAGASSSSDAAPPPPPDAPPDAPPPDAGRAADAAALGAQVLELRALVGEQQRRLEQLAQSNAQLQHQLLEHEEEKAETTLLITQLMTRVSALELGRSDGEGDGEDDGDGEDAREAEDEDDERDARGREPAGRDGRA